jgi:hypothetical protein
MQTAQIGIRIFFDFSQSCKGRKVFFIGISTFNPGSAEKARRDGVYLTVGTYIL